MIVPKQKCNDSSRRHQQEPGAPWLIDVCPDGRQGDCVYQELWIVVETRRNGDAEHGHRGRNRNRTGRAFRPQQDHRADREHAHGHDGFCQKGRTDPTDRSGGDGVHQWAAVLGEVPHRQVSKHHLLRVGQRHEFVVFEAAKGSAHAGEAVDVSAKSNTAVPASRTRLQEV